MTFPLLLVIGLLSCNSRGDGLANNNPRDSQATFTLQIDSLGNRKVIYLSRDKGRTWTSFDHGIPNQSTVNGFTSKGNKIFAVTNLNGVFVSENGANNWKAINNGLPHNVNINTIAVTGEVLVIGTFHHGIFVSVDEGGTWKASSTAFHNISTRCLIAVKDKLLAGTDKGIYASNDKGNTWEEVFGPIQVNGFTFLNEKVYAATSNGAVMSNDNGKNWVYIYRPNTLHDISNDGNFVYAMTLGSGLLKTSNDGASWENANNGLGAFNLYTFEVKSIGKDLLAAQWYGIYYLGDGSSHWSKSNTGLNGLPDSTAFTTLEITRFGILAGSGLSGKRR